MSDDLVNQLTLNFLISKQQLQKLNKKVKNISDERKIREIQEYKDRIKKLFSDLLVCQPPDDLLYEVKMSFDTFIEKSIYYFKAHDNSEDLEKERSEEIPEDIDYEKERDITNGNYEESSNDRDEEDNELEDGYNNDNEEKNEHDEEHDEEHDDEHDEEHDDEHDDEHDEEHDEEHYKYNIIEEQSKTKITNETINHTPIIVTSKYKKQTNSVGVDDIQKLPLDWFENVRQNYKKNKIIPRKKESTILEPTFRGLKKKI